MLKRASHILRAARALAFAGDRVGAEVLVEPILGALEVCAEDQTRADTSHRLASYYRDIGELERAAHFGRAAVDAERRVGRRALLGNHLMFLATLLRDMGDLRGAIVCAEEGVLCYADTHGRDHSETLYMLSVLANMRASLGA